MADGWLLRRMGGRARARVVVTLACVLGLDGADKGAIGAMSGPLENDLGISHTQVGLLLAVSLALGAVATLPFGWAVDRVNRTRLLAWAVAAWGVATLLSAAAASYGFLLAARLLLAAVVACAAPAVASLVGDAFPQGERGKIYSDVLAGELIGTGIGFLAAGLLAEWTWRAGFVALGIPAFALAWWIYRMPEPARGGRGVLEEGAPRVVTEDDAARDGHGGDDKIELRDVQKLARKEGLEPRARLLIDERPRNKSMWWAVKYVLRIPSNLVLITASALGYFFFSGIRTFGAQFMDEWFDLDALWGTVLLVSLGTGALVGVTFSGRLADWRVRRGHTRARVVVAAVAYLAACGCLLPALLFHDIWVSVPFFLAAALGLGATNPPMDAGRLDYMHPDLWGRAESVRTLLRQSGEAVAPLTVGWLADHVFDGAPGGATGLHGALLTMLIPLGVGALVALVGIRTYPKDVATAEENIRRTLHVQEHVQEGG